MTHSVAEPHERFPGFDVIAQSDTWDDVTRAVVLDRVDRPPAVTFFTPSEEVVARALLNRLLAQERDPRVPVTELIDARLASGEGDGYRYGDMPEDGDAWRRSLVGIDRDANVRFGTPFADLAAADQHEIIQAVQDCTSSWHGMPAARVFGLWMRYACTAYYSHPWAWNEIGFGGPAYPRGYKNIGVDRREPWETPGVDAADPIPWAERVEAARGRHESTPGDVRD
jgi:hypothetical protein